MSDLLNSVCKSQAGITGNGQIDAKPIKVFVVSLRPAAADATMNLRLGNIAGVIKDSIKAVANGPSQSKSFPNGMMFETFLFVEITGVGASGCVAYI